MTFAGLGLNLSDVMNFLVSLRRIECVILDGVQMTLAGFPSWEGVPLLAWLKSDEPPLDLPGLRRVGVRNCVVDMGALLVMLKRLEPLDVLSIEDDVLDEDSGGERRAGLRSMSLDDLQNLPRALREVKGIRLVNSLAGAFNVAGGGDLSGVAWMGIQGLRTMTLSLYSTPTDLVLEQMLMRNGTTLEELTIYADGAFDDFSRITWA